MTSKVFLKAFDGRGNYTLGIKEQLIFPEIDYDKVSKVRNGYRNTANTELVVLATSVCHFVNNL